MKIKIFLERIHFVLELFCFWFMQGWRLAHLGRRSIVRKPLVWTPSCIFVGDDVHIQPGCRIEGISRWGKQRFTPRIVFEDGVTVEQHCHFTALGELCIHKGTTITYGVMVTDAEHEYRNVGKKISSQPILYSLTEIGENCFLGAGAKIQAGTVLGKQCVVGANSVVRGTFPDYSVIVGVPGRIVKRYCIVDKKWKRTDINGEFLNE